MLAPTPWACFFFSCKSCPWRYQRALSDVFLQELRTFVMRLTMPNDDFVANLSFFGYPHTEHSGNSIPHVPLCRLFFCLAAPEREQHLVRLAKAEVDTAMAKTFKVRKFTTNAGGMPVSLVHIHPSRGGLVYSAEKCESRGDGSSSSSSNNYNNDNKRSPALIPRHKTNYFPASLQVGPVAGPNIYCCTCARFQSAVRFCRCWSPSSVRLGVFCFVLFCPSLEFSIPTIETTVIPSIVRPLARGCVLRCQSGVEYHPALLAVVYFWLRLKRAGGVMRGS